MNTPASETIRQAAELLDTLTSKLAEQPTILRECTAQAKPLVEKLYTLADRARTTRAYVQDVLPNGVQDMRMMSADELMSCAPTSRENSQQPQSCLAAYAEGGIQHRYAGLCPDTVNGPAARDPDCPVCAALDRAPVAAQEPVAMVGSVYQLLWAGNGDLPSLLKRHSLKPGSSLYAAPVAAQAQPEGEALQALSALVNALRERHHGRMPDEVQAAYDRAWSIVFGGEKAQQPVSGADGSDTERVLIDGTAYQVPAAVAGELLRLHLELHAAAQPQPSGNAPLHPVIREAVEATFEQREGWMTKIGAAVRHLPEKSQPSGNAAHDDAMERALTELVDKIDTGLDSGDILADARRASAALDGILASGDLVANAHDLFKSVGPNSEHYEHSVDFRIGWNACLDAIAHARAALAAQANPPSAGEDEALPFGALDDRASFPASTVRKLFDLKEKYRTELLAAQASGQSSGNPGQLDSGQEHKDGFSDGVLLALQVLTGGNDYGNSHYMELLMCAGMDTLIHRALEQDMWELSGMNRVAETKARRAAIDAARKAKGEA